MSGDCFLVAANLGMGMADDGEGVTIVHGTPIGTGVENRGVRYWHAWIEVDTPDLGPVVIDLSNGKTVLMGRDAFYRAGQLDESHVHRYTVGEAVGMMTRERHYGPWIDGWEAMAL